MQKRSNGNHLPQVPYGLAPAGRGRADADVGSGTDRCFRGPGMWAALEVFEEQQLVAVAESRDHGPLRGCGHYA